MANDAQTLAKLIAKATPPHDWVAEALKKIGIETPLLFFDKSKTSAVCRAKDQEAATAAAEAVLAAVRDTGEGGTTLCPVAKKEEQNDTIRSLARIIAVQEPGLRKQDTADALPSGGAGGNKEGEVSNNPTAARIAQALQAQLATMKSNVAIQLRVDELPTHLLPSDDFVKAIHEAMTGYLVPSSSSSPFARQPFELQMQHLVPKQQVPFGGVPECKAPEANACFEEQIVMLCMGYGIAGAITIPDVLRGSPAATDFCQINGTPHLFLCRMTDAQSLLAMLMRLAVFVQSGHEEPWLKFVNQKVIAQTGAKGPMGAAIRTLISDGGGCLLPAQHRGTMQRSLALRSSSEPPTKKQAVCDEATLTQAICEKYLKGECANAHRATPCPLKHPTGLSGILNSEGRLKERPPPKGGGYWQPYPPPPPGGYGSPPPAQSQNQQYQQQQQQRGGKGGGGYAQYQSPQNQQYQQYN